MPVNPNPFKNKPLGALGYNFSIVKKKSHVVDLIKILNFLATRFCADCLALGVNDVRRISGCHFKI